MSEVRSTCSVSTSKSFTQEVPLSTTTVCSRKSSKFCVNEIPWKLVPQICDGYKAYKFLDDKHRRLTDVESFVWKWSPCGRYGIDLPGGRENINQNLKNRMAVFDLHSNTWSLYTMVDSSFEIPRVCFLYWARSDIIATVTLIKDYEPRPDDDVQLKFRQSFYYISHEKKTVEHTASCKYRTNKTIVASYWYHIFENRHGEPFIDHKNNLWLVFSNGADSLILLPYLPTSTCYKAKCVSFDMNEIVSQLVGTRVYIDPFMSYHYVPWVYRNDINFFIRIDSYSFVKEHDRNDGQDLQLDVAETRPYRGVFQVRVDLKNVIEKGAKDEIFAEDPDAIETRFNRRDVKLWRKIHEDYRSTTHYNISQHGKSVVIQKWSHYTIDMNLTKKLGTRISDLKIREKCCSNNSREPSFCNIDLDNEKMQFFDCLLLGTEVIIPHPSGSVFLFRYKEIYGMTFCELPYFQPLTLQLKCRQMLKGCVKIDPNYYKAVCCLKLPLKENDNITKIN